MTTNDIKPTGAINMADKDKARELCERLNGNYPVWPNAEFGYRKFPVASIQIQAAHFIESQRLAIEEKDREVVRLAESERYAWKNTHEIEKDRQAKQEECERLRERVKELEAVPSPRRQVYLEDRDIDIDDGC